MTKPAPPSDGYYRVLVIEDDAELGAQIVAALSKARMMCRLVSNGIDGLRAWQEIEPHLVVLDLTMQGVDGTQVCARIRQSSTVPIMVTVTAQDSEEAQMQGLKAGADEVLEKPFSARLLAGRVVAHLRRAYKYDAGEDTAPDASQETPVTTAVVPDYDADKLEAAREIAAAVGELSDQNGLDDELNLAANGADTAQAVSGAAECEACGYSGPIRQFRADEAAGDDMLTCPNCGKTEHIAFAIG